MDKIISIFSIFLIILSFGVQDSQASRKNKYATYDSVPLQIQGIGPYNNPSEVYKFESLPLCKLTSAQLKHGVQYYEVPFEVPVSFAKSCSNQLGETDVALLKRAIDKNYYIRMKYDRIPAQIPIGFLSEATEEKPQMYFLFKHLHFNVSYNNDEVVYAEIFPDINRIEPLTDQSLSEEIDFSYSAEWHETSLTYKEMKDRSNSISMMEPRIHWLSIINSLVLILLLTGFLALIIMRVLKLDYDRYSKYDEENEGDEDEYGWKLIHGDVFRFPPLPNLFSAFIGLGTQCIAVMFSFLVISALGIFYESSRFGYVTLGIVLYGLASVIGGYNSAKLYKQLNGTHWAWNIVLEIALLLAPIIVVFTIINTVAVVHHINMSAILTSIAVIAVIIVVGIPLTIVGGVTGRRFGETNMDVPVRTRNIPRIIPEIPWFRSLPITMMMSGVLPFSAIYIELFYLFTSVWGYSSYELFGILFIVAVILLIVTACVTVAFVYFQLSMEDYRWWWSSLFTGGSTGLFIYGYSIFYYFYRSQMNGMIQATYFFLWMAIICYFFFIMLGSIGYFSSLYFIKKIYSSVKFD